MNAVEIEEAISQLAEQSFDAENFPYAFLEAFGNKETTIKRLRAGASNKSDLGGVLQTNRYVHPSEDAVLAAMANLGRHKIGHNHSSAQAIEIASTVLSQRKLKTSVVDVTGIEPATPCLQSARIRSNNCAGSF